MIAGKQYKVIAPNRILYADSPLRRSFIWDELNNSYETSLVKILADHWLELPEEEFDPARQRGARSEYDLLAPTDQATIKLIIQQGWAPPPKWWSAPVNSGPNSSGHTTT